MDKNAAQDTASAPSTAWEQRLFREFGPFVGGQALARLLGYPTSAAFRQAAHRGAAPIPLFAIGTQRGRFAHIGQLAAWLAARGVPAEVGAIPSPARRRLGSSHTASESSA